MSAGPQQACPTAVTFPCDLPQWSDIKAILKDIKIQDGNSAVVVHRLQKTYSLVHTQQIEEDEEEKEEGHPRKIPKNVFGGLKKFLDKTCSDAERQKFFKVTLPCIIDRVLELENLVPLEGLNICKQNTECMKELGRPLAASIVACGFLGLFPGRPCAKRFPLNAINFDQFFQHLENPAQCAKLRNILHYFERIALDPGGPVGKIILIRQVSSKDKLPSLDDWLSCDFPLCNMDVLTKGLIEDAGSKVIQVDFANRKPGGGVLTTGRVQEEIRFSVSPELLVSMLLMEQMADNEAILIQGFETFAEYTGYGKTLQFAGPHKDLAQRNSHGNLENTLCAIDALPGGRIGGAKMQYKDAHLLRELNKAYTGFQQDKLQPMCTSPCGDLGREEVECHRAMSEEYYSADDGLQCEGAVGGVPHQPSYHSPTDHSFLASKPAAPLESSSSCSAKSSSSHQDNQDSPSQFHHRKHHRDLPSPSSRLPRQHSQSSSSSERGESPRQSRFMPQKQLSQTLPAVTLPWQSSVSKQSSDSDDMDTYERRRSSNLSDAISRRSSSDSSRRSSSKRSSSEFSSEFEEYYESFQRQERKLKPIAIEEEAPIASLQDFAADLVSEAMQEGTSEAKVKETAVLSFRGVPHKPVAIKPEISPLLESSRESSGSKDACSHTLKFKFGDDLISESDDGAVQEAAAPEPQEESQGAQALPLMCNIRPEGKPALPDPMDIADILPQCLSTAASAAVSGGGASQQESTPIMKGATSGRPSTSKRSRGLPRQAGIVHFVDNLVNQASEESRQQLQSQSTSRPQPQAQARAQGSDLDLDFDLDLAGPQPEVAPMAPLSGEIHYTTGQEDGTRKKTHIIELKEESPPSHPPQLPYSEIGEYFNTNLPELSNVAIEEETPEELQNEPMHVPMKAMQIRQQTSKKAPYHPTERKHKEPVQNQQEDVESQHSITDEDSNQYGGNLRELRMTIQEGQDTGNIPVDVYIAISELSDDLVARAMGEAYGIMGIEPEAGPVDQESGEKLRRTASNLRHLEYYVEGLLRSVFRGALKSAAHELYKMKQTPSTMCSSEENLLLSYEMYAYVEDFVEDVMEDAIAIYHRQYIPPEHNRKRKSVEEIWVKPQSDREASVNARYFEAEFNPELHITRSLDLSEAKPVVPQSMLHRGLSDSFTLRRGSFDELVHHRGAKGRRNSASGFKNTVLSDFEDELVRSNVSSPSLKMLCFQLEDSDRAKRRASEPAAGHSFLDPGMRLERFSKQGQSCSSLDIMSSREMILDWLDDCSQSSHFSEGRLGRKRTTSSHLDWFAQDLLVDIFNDAFLDLFGPNYAAYRECLSHSQQRSVSTHSVDADSIDVESSHLMPAAQAADIPESLFSYADNLATSVMSNAMEGVLEVEARDARSLSVEAPSEYFDASDVPYSQLEMIADSFAWRIIEEARGLVRKEIQKETLPPVGLRPIATGNWGCGAYHGDPQLKAMLQWAAASRARAPNLMYYTFADEDVTQLEAVSSAFLEENYTIGQMLRLVFEYCRLRMKGETSVSLFEYFKESDA